MYSDLSIVTLVVSITLPMLAALAVALRFQARSIKRQALHADDYFIFASLIVSFGLCALSIYASLRAGVGEPLLMEMRNIPLVIKFFQFMFADVILYMLSVTLVKVSVILFYKRIFVTRAFRRIATFTLAFCAAWLISFFFGFVLSVTPLSDHWNPVKLSSIPSGARWFQTVFSSTDTALDLFVLCLPLPVIKSLQISTKRKFTVAGMFWLGSFCVISSSVRLYYSVQVYQLSRARNFPKFHSSVVWVLLWSRIEPCASIIAACLPTYGPLFTGEKSSSSFLRSFRSLLSLFSRANSSNISGENSESRVSIVANTAWREVNLRNAGRVEGNPIELDDLERGMRGRGGGTIFDKTFTFDSH